MKRIFEKSFSYFDFLDCFKKNGCPICYLIQEKEKRYAESLFYENVNDAVIRQIFRKARGFCEHHTSLLREIGDPLGLSIIMRDMINDIARAPEPSADIYNCPLCDVCRDVEERLVNSFQSSLKLQEFVHQFEQSSGLCYQHFSRIAMLIKYSSNRKSFKEVHLLIWNRYIEKLTRFIRKNSYQHANEKISEEEVNAAGWVMQFLCKRR